MPHVDAPVHVHVRVRVGVIVRVLVAATAGVVVVCVRRRGNRAIAHLNEPWIYEQKLGIREARWPTSLCMRRKVSIDRVR